MTRDALIARIREAGTDNLAHFGNGYTHEGGLGLQQNPEELADFLLFMRERGAKTCLEIGSASGGMAKLVKDVLGADVASIDDGKHPRFGEHPIATQFVGDSHSEAAKKELEGTSFDVVFIDGDHSYEGVKQDIDLAVPHAKFIAVHDTLACPGVARAWREAVDSGRIRHIDSFRGKEKPLGIAVGEVIGNKKTLATPEEIISQLKSALVSAQPHVMLATPAYNPPCLEFLHARDEVTSDLISSAVAVTVITSPGDSLVMRGRHSLVAEFLKSPCTHLLFWDVDIEPTDPTIVRQMLATGHDIIGGACPFRGDTGAVVCNIHQRDKDRGLIDTDHTGSIDVSEVGTGFLLMSRKAIVRICESRPDLLYFADLQAVHGEPMWAIFDTAIVNRRFLSEDYFFCRLWRDLGEKVYVYAPFEARHWGRKGFEASIMGALKMRAE